MANVRLRDSVIHDLTSSDLNILKEIYGKRCLNNKLILDYLNEDGISERSLDVRMAFMIEEKLIEVVIYKNEQKSYFLDTLGVEVIKQIVYPDLPNIKSAYSLKMHPQNINHQISLNRFAYKLRDFCLEAGVSYEYLDQKFMPFCNTHMMADGMALLNGEIYLLEMDMGTERHSNLVEKWDNYRCFLTSPGEYYQNKKVNMLFILDNVVKIGQRKDTVAKSINNRLIGFIHKSFEVYVDSPDELIAMFERKMNKPKKELRNLLSSHLEFSVSVGRLKGDVPSTYDFYVKSVTDHGRIQVIGGRAQEFFIDSWCDNRYSVLHNILHHNRYSSIFSFSIGRNIPYIIVVNNIKESYRLFSKLGISIGSDVFFTTIQRLKKFEWNRALFRIDAIGNVYHFSDRSLKNEVFEKKYLSS